jgi:hypothetical protein
MVTHLPVAGRGWCQVVPAGVSRGGRAEGWASAVQVTQDFGAKPGAGGFNEVYQG